MIHLLRQINDLPFHIRSFVHLVCRTTLPRKIPPKLQGLFLHLNNNVQLLELIGCVCPRLEQYVEWPTSFLILTVQNLISNAGVFQRMSDFQKFQNDWIVEGPIKIILGGWLGSYSSIVWLPFCIGLLGGFGEPAMLSWNGNIKTSIMKVNERKKWFTICCLKVLQGLLWWDRQWRSPY